MTYPNPSNGQFTLDIDIHTSDKMEVTIYNFSGKEVYRAEGTGKINQYVDLGPVKQITDHIFVAKLFTGGKWYNYKILTP